jgi:hypothetical protein
MNKTLIAMILLLALAGCGAPAADTPAAEAAPAAEAGSAADSGAAAEASAPASEILSDLGSVFGMSGAFTCTYRVGDVEQVSQVKDGKMRSDATVEGKQSHTIFSADTLWTWTDEGCFMMNMADIKAFADSMPTSGAQPHAQSRDDIAANAMNVQCTRASVPDSVFTPPSDCQDMGAMFKQMQNLHN